MNQRILIVDDDPVQLRMLSRILSEAEPPGSVLPGRFAVELFDSGVGLLSRFREDFLAGKRIPLCILDMRMTGFSGLEIAEALRRIDHEVFLIIITAHEDVTHDHVIRSLKRDIYFLKKPLRLPELTALISSLLINWNNLQALKNANRQLEHSRRQLQMFIENTPAPVAMLDRDRRFLAYSRQWTKELGLEGRELNGQCVYDVVSGIPNHWRREHERCLSGETIRKKEERFVTADGGVDFVNRELFPWRSADGDIGGMVIYFERVTEKKHVEDIRKAAEIRIKEKEFYLKTILSAIQTAVLIIDPACYRIVDVNPSAVALLGYEREELLGRDFYDLRKSEADAGARKRRISNEYALKTKRGDVRYVARSTSRANVRGRELLVHSLLDITDIKALMKKQDISIDLAKRILKQINGEFPRHTDLHEGCSLFSETVSIPCYREGGDHFFMKCLSDGRVPDFRKTVVSLKDQSGHEVGCILRCIITDWLHHRLLQNHPKSPVEDILSDLNRRIFDVKLFGESDFFTTLTLEIDHTTLDMRYVSAGHPPGILVRNGSAVLFPKNGEPGKHLPIPVRKNMRFQAGVLTLEIGDMLILFTDGLVEMPRKANKPVLSASDLASLVGEIAGRVPRPAACEMPREILDRITDAETPVDMDSDARFPDDVTLLCLEIEDRRNCGEETFQPTDMDDLQRHLHRLNDRLAKDLKRRRFPFSALNLRSILAESVINAYRHGNRCDPGKKVSVRWWIGNDLHIEVTDEGAGFDWDAVPDPRAPENVTRSAGRGIFIIRHFACSVSWRDNGRCMSIVVSRNATENRGDER